MNNNIECPSIYGINDNFIISPNIHERISLPTLVELDGDDLPGEPKYLKLRKPIALRYHKYKETTEPHEFFFSEMELYSPFRVDSELYPDDVERCQDLYIQRKFSIQYTKSRVMEFLEVVDEARVTAEEMLNDEIAVELDAEQTQDNAECEMLGNEDNETFITMDSDLVRKTADDGNLATEEKILRGRIDSLDEDQKCVIDIGITYAKDILKFRSGKAPLPTPPLIVVQGSAGSGKSHVIDLLSQWIEKLLRAPGDSPSQPYVIKCAFAGTAAAKVGGQTITSAFNTGIGNKFQSLADKTRDLKRTLLSNLSVVIIDEYSMMKADLMYQLDLRLREVKHKPELPFGGCSVFLFGDTLQLSPVLGVYPFQKPICPDYHVNHILSPLWDKFQPVVLRQNHRQGEDKLYADMLIRISRGSQTQEDLDKLSEYIKPKSDPSLPNDALYIFCLNADANEQNEIFLDNIDGPEIEINAIVKHNTIKNFNPMIERD